MTESPPEFHFHILQTQAWR